MDTLAKLPKERLESVNAQALPCWPMTQPTTPCRRTRSTRGKRRLPICFQENADGGWAYEGSVSEASMTAMVLSALAPYKDRADVQAALEKWRGLPIQPAWQAAATRL
ncbi:MAG: hypothetical protein ACLT0Y_02195 [Christensenellales bacterium]